MSNRWPGGLIRKTPVTPAGPFQNGAASGVWSLADAAYWTKQGLWPLAGNTPPAIEDYFSTYLYTGNGSTQTITNGIDLAGKGGLVWIKSRSNIVDNFLFDTTRGVNVEINSNKTDANATLADSVTAFNSNGFTIGNVSGIGANTSTFASWTFREAPKFFDIVTYTGDGANRNIAHNLGIAPGCIIVKRTDTAADWQVYHRSNANTQYMVLNSTATAATGSTRWNSTTPTATEFTVGTDATVNASGGTYVAYLFAHDPTADGFIQCGSYTGNGSATGPIVTLGWEPQWLMIKRADSTGNWSILDNMRGMPDGSADRILRANLTSAEATVEYLRPTATGFQVDTTDAQVNASGSTYVYIAIRRGPMRTPTLGTSVFAPVTYTGNGSTQALTAGFTVDLGLQKGRAGDFAANSFRWTDRLRGATSTLGSNGAAAEFTTNGITSFASNTNVVAGADGDTNGSNTTFISYLWRRAPSFFDEVGYMGTGNPLTLNHNLGVAPELIIYKARSSAYSWIVQSSAMASVTGDYLILNGNGAKGNISNIWRAPTTTTFGIALSGNLSEANYAGTTYVAYLFASCPGVSKVGSYTGNGSSQTINCAFTTGARFVMIKRADSTGDWYVWDSARGIVAGNDPYLALNTTAAEVTTDDSVDTDNTGFIVNQVAASNVNVNGGTYIFLAIA